MDPGYLVVAHPILLERIPVDSFSKLLLQHGRGPAVHGVFDGIFETTKALGFLARFQVGVPPVIIVVPPVGSIECSLSDHDSPGAEIFRCVRERAKS